MEERSFDRSFASLEPIYAFLRSFLNEHGLDEQHAWDLDLIAEELFTNMVKYGSGSQPIALGLSWNRPIFTMVLREFDSVGFDPNQAPEVETARPISERRAGGLGIHLVRRVADRIEFKREDRQSTITIHKKLET